MSAGSVHCDIWNGSALELATRDALAIFPVSGWWRERSHLGRTNDTARYSVIATLTIPSLPIDINLYQDIRTEIEQLIAQPVSIQG